ncbi:type II toxin-antitoxin system RelE/ParE family toxin [Dyadobacter sandarakinus]|uniref:Type II toxin-antitoxin system RelE/ParE family toxin n=1 Tax=Dyadobacter sandarakinus TaxID=2747268 RepID=A0ABX7IA94_9BACT|nr:type II toxin-antitoxin system RelE/ParE family toxin [Dyadobacter sandarakinus]
MPAFGSQTKKYRNARYGGYLIIYKVSDRIEVLNIIHASRSISKIRSVRKISILPKQ